MSYEIEHERVTKECGWSWNLLGEHYETNCDRRFYLDNGRTTEDVTRCPGCKRVVAFEGEDHE